MTWKSSPSSLISTIYIFNDHHHHLIHFPFAPKYFAWVPLQDILANTQTKLQPITAQCIPVHTSVSGGITTHLHFSTYNSEQASLFKALQWQHSVNASLFQHKTNNRERNIREFICVHKIWCSALNSFTLSKQPSRYDKIKFKLGSEVLDHD